MKISIIILILAKFLVSHAQISVSESGAIVIASPTAGNSAAVDKHENVLEFLQQQTAHDNQTLARQWQSNYDYYDDEAEYTRGSFKGHICQRQCRKGESMTCYYKMYVHDYYQMGRECSRCLADDRACKKEGCIFGDGVRMSLMVINRQIPGPPIAVCQHDRVIVDVTNDLAESITLHWHGVHMSQSPEMDGAPYITQYPIQPGQKFRYDFTADRFGTVWYHSHMGWQRALGVAGSFVIRQPKTVDYHSKLYDYDLIEHTIMLQDTTYNHTAFTKSDNIIINGKGRNHLRSWPDGDLRHRYEQMTVRANRRYRVRLISNGVMNCPLEISIQNHKMLIISTDGHDLEPQWTDKLYMVSAERFDFILDTNQRPGNYWLRVKGHGICSEPKLYQGAIIHYRSYKGHPMPKGRIRSNKWQSGREVIRVNIMPEAMLNDRNAKAIDIATTGLRSVHPIAWDKFTEFITYYTSFNMFIASDGQHKYQIDNITYRRPQISLLQGRHIFEQDSFFCNRTYFRSIGRNCSTEQCRCTNVIRIPAFKAIEMVISNPMSVTHPYHIHGFTFRCVGQGQFEQMDDVLRIEELDRKGLLRRDPYHYPSVAKDTLQVPPRGYAIVRFMSNNPGYWYYHCHLEPHALGGMTAVLKVGEHHEMKKIPQKSKW